MELTIRWRFLVGIDISKLLVEVCLLDRKTGGLLHKQADNNREGFARIGKWSRRLAGGDDQ